MKLSIKEIVERRRQESAGAENLTSGIPCGGGYRPRDGDHLWALGPLTKGRYWEIIAVPDIREQADQIANDIQRELAA